MKFTLSWLKTHLETDAPLSAIVDKLSMIGLEVEDVEDRAADLAPFTVAYVKEARPHPNADRLKVCVVETGSGEVQVVCGGPNARTGMKGVFAPAGSFVPGTGLELKKSKIRGEESNGMLLSEREVGLSDEHEGIIELADDAPVGEAFAKLLGLDDPVIDINITPNRGDCLGVRGIARDLAAAGLGRLVPFAAPAVEGRGESRVKWRRDLPADQQHACPYVAGKTFTGVANGPSPAWLQRRLRAIGLRPISALVDITNFVTYDLGRPLHVFDADKLTGDLTMRMARDGEEILALDGKTYVLDPEMVVIADEAGPHGTPVGIGGVMGGELTGCTEATTSVFLEVALFDPVRVAATGRELGIISDARYRFERGLDPESAEWGVAVAAKLIAELCGGEASETTSAGEIPRERRSVAFRPGRVKSLGGCLVAEAEQRRILADLGFEVAEGAGGAPENDAWQVQVPLWRPDVEGEACLVEEVLRLYGYEHLPMSPTVLDTTLPLPSLSLSQRHEAAARTALAWRGMHEAVTFSFLDARAAALFGETPEALRLANPISVDLEVMRPSLLPNLIAAAARNADRGIADAALFEVGPEYRDDTADGQVLVAAGLRGGASGPRHWSEPPRPVDAFDAKGDAFAVLEACGAPTANLQASADAPGWYHPGRSGALRLGPTVLAWFGEVHPRVLRRLGLKAPAAAFEVFLERVPAPRSAKGGAKAGSGKAKPHLTLSPFQPVVRDFAFVVDEQVAADALLRAAAGADKALISEVAVFDVYQGKGIEDGKKSLAIAVTLQPTEKTLTDPEIEAVAQRIVDKVAKATGGVLRA